MEYSQSLPEIRGNRGLDDFPRWFGHQPSHSRKLANLLGASPCPGIGHHEDGVETFNGPFIAILVGDLLRSEFRQHLIGDFFRFLGPYIDDLIVAFTIGNQSLGVLFPDFLDLLVSLGQKCLLIRGNQHILYTDRDSR